jgi:uncharacterized protein
LIKEVNMFASMTDETDEMILADAAGPVDAHSSRHVRVRPLPYDAVHINGGFWAQQRDVNRRISLQHGYRMLQEAGNFHNLRLAAGLERGEYSSSLPFLDSDLYKWLEAVAYELHNGPDPELERMANETTDLLAQAQGPDGYLNSYYTVVKPGRRWMELKDGHELYCAGHLFQAAVAHQRMRGDTKLLGIACRLADCIDSVFGPGKRRGVCGHPEIETALIELYRATGEERYLALATYFLDERGHGTIGCDRTNAAIYQEHTTVREASTVEGHVVRALYLTAGVADLYMETGEKALLDALLRQWHDMTSHKLFVTGGVGSRMSGEAFGEPYELPNDICYCETCAQIASIMWNWRMLLITGEGRFADLMERTLFNSFISGRSLDGVRTRYENPLLRRGLKPVFGAHGNERADWYRCACCPPNIMRLLSSLSSYLVTANAGGVQLQHYAPMDVTFPVLGGPVHLHVQTDYPWQETVLLSVEQTPAAPWTLSFRIPAWCANPTLRVNDKRIPLKVDAQGYASLERSWQVCDFVELQLPMPPRLTVAHPRVDPARGSVVIERGPLVYCLESVDQQQGFNLMDVSLADTHMEPLWRDDVLGGIVVIKARGYAANTSAWKDELYRPLDNVRANGALPVSLTAIPYYAWDNRGLSALRVWIPFDK